MSDGEVDREAIYEQTKEWILQNTVAHAEQKAVRETELKTTLCANGDLDPDKVRTALKALGEQGIILYGSGWITPIIDGPWLRDAIEYVVPKEESPEEFVAVCNNYLM
jgi:hypothetical protein